MTNEVGQVLIAGIHRHHFIQAKQRERRYHGLPGPSLARLFTIEALNQQNVLSEDALELYGCSIETSQLRKPHGDEFCFDDVVDVRTCRKLCNEFFMIRSNQHLGPCTSQRRAMLKCVTESWLQ